MANVMVSKLTKDLFIHEYLRNGMDAVRAYSKLKPHTAKSTVITVASTILRDAYVQDKIKKAVESGYTDNVSNIDALVMRVHEDEVAARKKGDIATALKAIKLIGELTGRFSKEDKDMKGYKTIMQTLVINKGQVEIKQRNDKEHDIIEIREIKDDSRAIQESGDRQVEAV